MADRIIKSDSGNDVVIQNNDASRKIEVTNSGDVEVTGDFKTTTVKATNLKANDGTAALVVADSTGEVTSSGGIKATNVKTTNLKANDGTASLEIADSTGDIGFSGNTNLKIKLPSGGGLYESDGSTEILTESSGAVSLKNTILNANNTFPSGFVRNVDVQAFTTNVFKNNTSSLETIKTFTYTPVFSGTSKIYADLFVMGFTGNNVQDTRVNVKVEITGSGITDRTLNSDFDDMFGVFDHGASGMQLVFATTLICPRVTSSDTQAITYTLKAQLSAANSSTEIQFNGNSNEDQSHIKFMEVL